MRSILTISLLTLSLTPVFTGHAVYAAGASIAPCSVDAPCTLKGKDGGTYHLALPEGGAGKAPLKPFVFFHGHNGSAKGVVKNKGLMRRLGEQGFAIIAPDGPLFTFRGRTAQGWAARPEGGSPRGNRDDIAFVERVLKDAATKANLDLNETVVSGFSSGGSMAWYFSCYSKAPLAGVVALAGGLRRPLPDNGIKQLDGSIAKKCPAGPRHMVHIHGFTDRQVPLEGRGIRAWHQGDVFEGLAVQRHTNQCGSRPDKVESKGDFWCRSWTKCKSGKSVSMCLHSGGHGMPKGWLKEGLKALEGS